MNALLVVPLRNGIQNAYLCQMAAGLGVWFFKQKDAQVTGKGACVPRNIEPVRPRRVEGVSVCPDVEHLSCLDVGERKLSGRAC